MGFAPYGAPRYACGIILEHSGHIVTAAPIARDCMTYLFDPVRAMDTLLKMEEGWGGDIAARMRADAAHWQAQQRQAANPDPEASATVPPAANQSGDRPE